MATPFAVVSFEYTTTRVSSDHTFSHVLFFLYFVFYETVPILLFVVGWSFFFFVAPSLAVFMDASVFNQDVSKWNTGAVTNMNGSKCTLLSLSVATPSAVVYFEYTTTRVSSDHNSHTFCYFCFCVFDTVLYFVVCGGLVFSLLHPLLQCLITHVRSIRTCPNGIRGR